MIDWNAFYKAIGIAENILDPSYYHILDLDVKDCDRLKVERALTDKKRQLRQSIPSPEFIAPMLLFEKEVLQKAAEVLGDDTQRAAYNEQLMTRQREIESKNFKKQKLIADVRDAIAEAVDEKGMLGGVERYLLEEKLRLLEVQEHNIKQILARIPEPSDTPVFDQQRLLMFFAGAVQLSINNQTLGALEEKNLMQLAQRLGLDDMQARLIIDQQLAQLTARREGVKQGGVSDIILERPIRLEEPPVTEKQEPVIKKSERPKTVVLPPEDIEEAVEKMQRVTVEKVLQFVVPIFAIAVFIATVFFLNAMNQKRNAVPDSQALLPAVKPKEPVDKPAVEKQTSATKVKKTQQQPRKNDNQKVAKPEVPQITELAGDLYTYQLCESDTSADAMLADSAVLMMAVCERAFDFKGLPGKYSRDLKEMTSDTKNRIDNVLALADELGGKVDIDDMKEEIVLLRLDELKRILHSDREQDRHYAIGRLALIRHPQAYEIALEALEDKSISDKSRTVINGLLAVCAQSGSPGVAHKLAEMMERAGRPKAFQIEMTLMNMTGIVPMGRGVLALKNTLQQRRDASAWWQSQVWSWQGGNSNGESDVRRHPFEKTLELAAIVATLTRQAAATLSDESFADDETYIRRLRLKYGFDCPDIDQLKHSPAAATGFLADVIEQLTRQHAPDAVKTDTAALNRKVHLLLSDSDVQTAVVNLSAVIDCLGTLAEAEDVKGQYRQLASDLRQSFQAEMESSEDDWSEFRTACYHAVRHWDLLLQIKENSGR